MAKTGILLHVYHLEAKGWEEFVWGDPEADRLGTLPQFAHMLLNIPADENVQSVIFSGPSEKDGMSEGAYAKHFLQKRTEELAAFPSLQEIIGRLSFQDYDTFLARIDDLIVGPVIRNTLDEVVHAAELFGREPAADKVFQIAAASHAPRCLQNQMLARRDGRIPKRQPWYVVASDVCFPGSHLEDIIILEPPHRGDDPMAGHHPTIGQAIRPYFAMDTDGKKRLIRTIHDAARIPDN